MFFFFFSFEHIENQPIIQEAFRQICVYKLQSDSYCDLEEYITGRILKKDIILELKRTNSPILFLYKNPYPVGEEEATTAWEDFEKENKDFMELFHNEVSSHSNSLDVQLSSVEAKALVNWVYCIYSNIRERKDVTEKILPIMNEIFSTGELDFEGNTIYVKSEVEIKPIASFKEFCFQIKEVASPEKMLFYRGHSDSNNFLLPSIMRVKKWKEHERDMHKEILIECPKEFNHCSSHIDYLVHMQHYGLPTRLLDITRNPLVALFFACERNQHKNGEVVVFESDYNKIKYPGSDTVTVIASLSNLENDLLDKYSSFAEDECLTQDEFNEKLMGLLHEIKFEKPAFKDRIRKSDILDCFFVLAEKKNNRIIKQDGAFIICGLFNKQENPINKYRYSRNKKKQIYIIEAKAKKSILEELNKFSINSASLFPEISDVANFIKRKYEMQK